MQNRTLHGFTFPNRNAKLIDYLLDNNIEIYAVFGDKVALWNFKNFFKGNISWKRWN